VRPRPGHNLRCGQWQQILHVADAALPGEKAGQGRAAFSPAEAVEQSVVDAASDPPCRVTPDRAGVPARPVHGPGAVSVGPG
jgi:hypothetical protein